MSANLLSGELRTIFIEETDDGLEIMEQGLLRLDAGARDAELIHTIFRAAHSIKGGAGTFSLSPMVDLTHHAESLLDQVRTGSRPWSSDIGSALLSAIDELRLMLDEVRAGRDMLPAASTELLARLEALVGAPTSSSDPDLSTPGPSGRVERLRTVTVRVRPHSDMMVTGNDPVLLLRELARLGAAQVTCDASDLPTLEALDPHACHLKWDVRLETSASDDDIREVFSWVEDECDVEISDRCAQPSATEVASPDPDGAAPPRRHSSGPEPGPRSSSESASIRVGIEKVDALVDMVGELVITQSMLSQLGRDPDPSQLQALRAGIQQLERNTRELQEGVMRMRMLPIGVVFARLPRLVRDLSHQLGKSIELVTTGEATELDKTVLEKMSDPLVHLVRNSLDHGIEPASVRKARGKPERGTIEIAASHQSGAVVIELRDDGGGIDTDRLRDKAIERGLLAASDALDRPALLDLIFHPGLSTAAAVSDISGRGVGMDVVRRNIHELGGTIEVESTPEVGTRLTIRLPLTLAILDGQLFRLGRQTYVLPLVSVVESLVPNPRQLRHLAGGAEVYRLRDAFIPLLRLRDVFGLSDERRRLEDGLIIVAEGSQGQVGLFVDELLGQQQVVIKSLERNFGRVDGVAGATILGNGQVALIADVPGLLRLRGERARPVRSSADHRAA